MSKVQYNIRLANESDAVAIASIGYNAWQDTYKEMIPNEFLESIDLYQQVKQCEKKLKEGAEILIATNERNLPIGYCSFGLSADLLYPKELEIYSLYVSKDFRSKGLGGILLFEVERRMSSLRPILVRVLKENKRARKFFEQNGYKYISGRDGVFRNVAPDVAYVKNKTA